MEALITLTGNCGTDVDYTTGDGWAFARFRLACTPRRRIAGEWCDDETTWIGVSCARALADHVAQCVIKGEPLIVVGKLRTRTWIDSEGETQSRQIIEATTVGHDLSRGISTFSKTERHRADPVPEPDWEALEERDDLKAVA